MTATNLDEQHNAKLMVDDIDNMDAPVQTEAEKKDIEDKAKALKEQKDKEIAAAASK